jgi:hypothetical protein
VRARTHGVILSPRSRRPVSPQPGYSGEPEILEAEVARGDGSPVQEQYGGPWQKYWILPVAFACPHHRMLLMDDCPQEHSSAEQGNWQLIRHAAGSTMHPAQCRRPARAAGRGPASPSCGTRLDLPGTGNSRPDPADQDTLDAQQRLLSLLDGLQTAEAAATTFTDIKVITALLCDSWPLGRELMDPRMAAAVNRHVRRLNVSSYRALARPPGDVLATAGLLTAAVTILDSPDLAGTVARRPNPQDGKPQQVFLGTGPRPAPSRMLGRTARRRRAGHARFPANRRPEQPQGPVPDCRLPPRAHPRPLAPGLV